MSRLQARRQKEPKKARGQTWTAHQIPPSPRVHADDPTCSCLPAVVFEDHDTGSRVYRHQP